MEDDVQVKLCEQEITRLDLHVKATIQDIRDGTSSLETLQDLSQDVRDNIQDFKDRVEELEKLANEQDKETDKILILKEVEKHRGQLSSNQSALRRANLACQLSTEKREKEELFSGSSGVVQRKKTNKENMANQSSEITENLMKLSRMMSTQVRTSENTMNNLVSSSNQIEGTKDELRSMTGHIHQAKKLLTKYGRREVTDKLLIFLALVFFFATVLYIVKKRVFDTT